MTINLKYSVPVLAFFAPCFLIWLLALIWGVEVSPDVGMVFSLILGFIAALCSFLVVILDDVPDMRINIGKRL